MSVSWQRAAQARVGASSEGGLALDHRSPPRVNPVVESGVRERAANAWILERSVATQVRVIAVTLRHGALAPAPACLRLPRLPPFATADRVARPTAPISRDKDR